MFSLLRQQRQQRAPSGSHERYARGHSSLMEVSQATTRPRRQYRSRNCRTFRLYGPFFQFADPESDRQLGIVRRGQRFIGSRASSRQESELRRQLQLMQRQVEQLREQRDLVESRMINTTNHAAGHAMTITQRFYELFGHGYDPIGRPALALQAEGFLRAMMIEDVKCTEFSGVSLFLKQYEVSTASHFSLQLHLQGVSVLDSDCGVIRVKAEARARFRISRETLRRFFPSIIQDEEFTQQLIGKEYEMQYDKVFHFAEGKIFQHESRIDMCTGLLQMVGSPLLAVKLFEASLMTKHGHWKIDSEVVEDRHRLENSAL